MMDNLSMAVFVFPIRMLTSFSVDEILLSRYINWSTKTTDGRKNNCLRTPDRIKCSDAGN